MFVPRKIEDYLSECRVQYLLCTHGQSQVFPSLESMNQYVIDFLKSFPEADSDIRTYIVKYYEPIKVAENE